jgi:hypothetical protein
MAPEASDLDDWRALNERLASVPVTITHGEDGEPLPDMSDDTPHLTPVEEDDDELLRADPAFRGPRPERAT